MTRLLVCLALVCACGKSSGSADDQIGHVVAYTPPADVDPASVLPMPADGGPIVLSGTPSLQLAWSPPKAGPMTATAACTRWVTGCLSATRSLDDCARSAPACKTTQPWNEAACCPVECFQRYADARRQGTAAKDAFRSVYLDSTSSCMPGLAAAIRGGR